MRKDISSLMTQRQMTTIHPFTTDKTKPRPTLFPSTKLFLSDIKSQEGRGDDHSFCFMPILTLLKAYKPIYEFNWSEYFLRGHFIFVTPLKQFSPNIWKNLIGLDAILSLTRLNEACSFYNGTHCLNVLDRVIILQSFCLLKVFFLGKMFC